MAIDARRALTCAHVVLSGGVRRADLWVSFPKYGPWDQRYRVARVDWNKQSPEIADVAVLHFDEELPPEVEPARLRAPMPRDVKGLRWWAFGFPSSSRVHGNEASGLVGAMLAHGQVLLDTDSSYPVETGFSGAGLWVPEYQGGAVIGIVTRARPRDAKVRPGDAQALTLAAVDGFLPDAKLRVLIDWRAVDAGAVALASWGWKLSADREARRHFGSRARGVTGVAERGYRFRGRDAALLAISGWLDREVTDRRVLVVTGSPGVGKSAVLGRVVTTADAGLAAMLPAEDAGVRARVGSVACAVHAKGKTALEVAREIAAAASAGLPQRLEELVELMAVRLDERPSRFNVVVDAVDEADTAEEARLILRSVVLPLLQACGSRGVQVVLGSRRADGRGLLLDVPAGAAEVIDLDDERFFALEDLAGYALATLRMAGDERPGNPYDEPDNAVTSAAVADRIAALAGGNFLVAGLEARWRGMYDAVLADPGSVVLTASVDEALTAYVQRLPAVEGVPADSLLAALAYAEAPGWTLALWHAAVVALGCRVSEEGLAGFVRSAAANFLVESSADGEQPVFRLFHQSLNDALLRPRDDVRVRADEGALTTALTRFGRERGWEHAPEYLLRSLPGHAARAGMIDHLLADDAYLLSTDLLRLIPAAAADRTATGRHRVHLLRLTPQTTAALPPERAALLSLTQALQQLPVSFTHRRTPYQAQWASLPPRHEHATLEGHTGWVNAVCPGSSP
ncbi:AAA family ATPase, partial [Actinoplanes subglobosus]